MRDLIEKAKIPISKDEGRVLLGVLDETGTLQYGQVFIMISKNLHEDLADKRIINSKVVISKNPCLHPGDIRVFDAVDVPALHHLVDVVVFPSVSLSHEEISLIMLNLSRTMSLRLLATNSGA